jgi:uroporphyrinogen-III synthase
MKVIVTRPRAQAQLLAERIAALGHEVVSCPLIEIVHISDDPIECGGYAWVIVTSPNGADEVARRARNLPKVAAVGPGTAETLRSHGIEPALVASVSTEEARRAPIEALGADYLPLYATVPLSPDPPEGDVVVLASGSAARAYAAIGGQAPVISIGPETTRIALSSGLTVAVEAKAHDLDGLVDAVAEFAAR